MPQKGKRNREALTAGEMRFVDAFQGDITAACRAAGYVGVNHGFKMMKRPRVAKAIAQKQEKALSVSAMKLGRKIDISRNDIIMGLADIAKTGESDSARVSAWSKLSDIFGLDAKRGKDLDIFAGWTDEELDKYRRTGQLPVRFAVPEEPGLSAEPNGKDKPTTPAIPPGS